MTTTYKYSSDRAFRDLLGLLIEEGFESQHYSERNMLQYPEDYRNGYVAIHREKKTYNVQLSEPAKEMNEWFPGMVLGEVRKMKTEHLTTEEFVKKVKDLGYYVQETWVTVYIKSHDHHNTLLANIGKDSFRDVNTSFAGFDNLKTTEKIRLWNVIDKYIATPVEKRTVTYYVKINTIGNGKLCINMNPDSEVITINDTRESPSFKTRFTKEEAEELKQRVIDGLEIVEVE